MLVKGTAQEHAAYRALTIHSGPTRTLSQARFTVAGGVTPTEEQLQRWIAPHHRLLNFRVERQDGTVVSWAEEGGPGTYTARFETEPNKLDEASATKARVERRAWDCALYSLTPADKQAFNAYARGIGTGTHEDQEARYSAYCQARNTFETAVRAALTMAQTGSVPKPSSMLIPLPPPLTPEEMATAQARAEATKLSLAAYRTAAEALRCAKPDHKAEAERAYQEAKAAYEASLPQ